MANKCENPHVPRPIKPPLPPFNAAISHLILSAFQSCACLQSSIPLQPFLILMLLVFFLLAFSAAIRSLTQASKCVSMLLPPQRPFLHSILPFANLSRGVGILPVLPGCRTGNGEKLSCSQAEPGQSSNQLLLSFPCDILATITVQVAAPECKWVFPCMSSYSYP